MLVAMTWNKWSTFVKLMLLVLSLRAATVAGRKYKCGKFAARFLRHSNRTKPLMKYTKRNLTLYRDFRDTKLSYNLTKRRENRCDDWNNKWKRRRCATKKFQCKDGDNIHRQNVNDGKIDCANGNDDFLCNITQGHVNCDCVYDDDQCTSSGRCIPVSWIGDTIPDCENHNDEPCNAPKVWCDDWCVIINQCSTNQSKNILLRSSHNNSTRCHHITIPSNQSQFIETNWICITFPCAKCLEVFQCESGKFIDNAHYCDTDPQCKDGSDEETKGFGFRCSGRSRTHNCVLPQTNVYDSIAQCADHSDICFVNGEFRCFSCLDGKLIISAKQVCDGMVDCYDMSDECLCVNQSVCNAVLGEETSRCPSNQMHCCNDTECVEMDKVLCNSSVDCMGTNTGTFCHQGELSNEGIYCCGITTFGNFTLVMAARCDKRPECADMRDECDCYHRPQFCDDPCAVEARNHSLGNRVCDGYHNDVGSNSSCAAEVEKNCPMRFYCKSKDMISIDVRSLCDGILDCDDYSDENHTRCQSKRFNCTKGNAISINKAFVCDGIKDCDNAEDEATELCEHKRFYCENGDPISVDKKSVENGIKDCSDGSDECISLFSDQYEMVANPILRALFWIMGLFALIGNVIINFRTAKSIRSCKRNNVVKLANNVFMLNLTISDFLMGVYLIAVVVQGLRYSRSYYLFDKEWRSSHLCSGLGTLALLSSETSSFIMTAMSTFRLITIYKPFLSSSIKIKWIVVTGISCWILSTLLAMLPLFPFDSGYFVSDVWFPNTFLKTDTVSKVDMFTLARRVSTFNSTSWFKVKEVVSDAFKYDQIKGEFGYYGETSVCIPRLYSSTDGASWQYSIFLITLNFVLFIYMVFAYVLVYRNVANKEKSQPGEKDSNKGLQKRISRLLLTDFFCWIPVCIMGYLSVAGVSLPPNAYIVSAGLLLPINSAMNPIVYTKFFDRCVSRTKKWIIKNSTKVCSCFVQENDDTDHCDVRIEMDELRVIEVNR